MPLKTKTALTKDRANADAKDVLQHRHFAVIAGIIKQMDDAGIRRHTAEHFALELGATNAKFDRKRFIAACLEE